MCSFGLHLPQAPRGNFLGNAVLTRFSYRLLTSTLKEYHISAPLSSRLRKSFWGLLWESISAVFAAELLYL